MYEIVVQDTRSNLVKKINEMLENGYIPVGNPFQQGAYLWFQAVYKPQKEAPVEKPTEAMEQTKKPRRQTRTRTRTSKRLDL